MSVSSSIQDAINVILDQTPFQSVDELRGYVKRCNEEDGWLGGVLDSIDTVNTLLPTKPEHKKVKWIQPHNITGFSRCSNCNALWDNSLIENRYFRYCPRCGV